MWLVGCEDVRGLWCVPISKPEVSPFTSIEQVLDRGDWLSSVRSMVYLQGWKYLQGEFGGVQGLKPVLVLCGQSSPM